MFQRALGGCNTVLVFAHNETVAVMVAVKWPVRMPLCVSVSKCASDPPCSESQKDILLHLPAIQVT